LEKPFLPADFEAAVERLLNPNPSLSKYPATRSFVTASAEWLRRR